MAIPIRSRKPMPLKGLMTALPADSLELGYTPNCLNVHFRFGEVRPRPGTMSLGTIAGGEILWIGYFDSGVKWPLVISDQKIFRRGDASPSTPETWYEIAGTGFTSSQLADIAIGEDYFFFTVGGSVFRWDGTGSSNYEALPVTEGGSIFAASIPQAKHLTYFNDRLILANTIEASASFPYRIRWPENGDHLKWDVTQGEGAGFLDVYRGGI